MLANILSELSSKFSDKVEIFRKTEKSIYVSVLDRGTAIEVVKFLFVEKRLRFSTASGLDRREGIEILYHMADDGKGMRVTVRVLVSKNDLNMPSCTSFMPAADWIEREIHEMFGVNFVGHPNLHRLLLPDDWPDQVYPLRKG